MTLGRGRCSPRAVHGRPAFRGDAGTVTAETAVVLPVLVTVLAFAVWTLGCVSSQLRCVDAARVAARLAARGEVTAEVSAAAAEAAPRGATVQVTRVGDQVLVVVHARIRPFGPQLPGLPAVEVEGRAVALDEATVGRQVAVLRSSG